VQAQPNYGPPLCVLGLIDAALGQKELALQEGRRAIVLVPIEKDFNNGRQMVQYFAIIAAWTGGGRTLPCTTWKWELALHSRRSYLATAY
jgi:hypothetical protein